jgi:hypothetical protein
MTLTTSAGSPLGAVPIAVLGDDHPHAGWRFFERFDGAEVLSHDHA